MKILIISDIHSDYKSLDLVTKKETFDKLIILGDLFSYSFHSNNLKDNSIIKLLQRYKDKLILIKGNCDYYLDYEKLNLFAHDIITLTLNNHIVTFTHGHLYNKGFLPSYHGDIFISGHTHIPLLIKEKNIIYANPGSIGMPRGISKKSYIIFDDNKIAIKDLDNNIQKEMTI